MLFISLEGPEGAGKSSVGNLLAEQLKTNGYKVLFTREPGGTEIAEAIRKVILSKKNINLNPWTEALLYIAARKQHLEEIILPALKAGKIVISDRYMDSTLAYQGYARKLGTKAINEIQNIVNIKKPHITIFFDIEPQKGLERVFSHRSDKEKNRLDFENINFHQEVYEGYKVLIAENQPRIKVINARLEPKQVLKQVYEIIIKKIKANETTS